MLSRDPEGRLCVEDGEGRVVLDMEDAVSPTSCVGSCKISFLHQDTEGPTHAGQVPGEGLFTEGCMVLIEGEYTVEETIRVLAMGHPPSEKRDIAR
jgi:DNA polymerase epsilon subunit 2